MNKKENKYELMAPVGNFTTLKAALKSGADAVYFGLDNFSMRKGKNNFKIQDLNKIRKICNSCPRKPLIYLTINTIIFDSEIKKLEILIKKIKNKIDAVICWDFAVMEECKKNNIPIIVSTQASISNKKSALFYKKYGAKRIVLARELSLKQIKEISTIKGLEIEVFVHGAMCVSISGRCFVSQFLFNKSANRGECFQPCRRSYTVIENRYHHELKIENNKIMSAKDLCTLHFIQKLKKIGVKSFKIEGRNRDVRYINNVVAAYRKAIDYDLDKKETELIIKKLNEVFNRGFSTGFYLGQPGIKDFSDVENSASNIEKEFVGKIKHLYPKVNTGLIKLSGNLRIKDKIAVIHEKIGVEEMIINEIKKEGKIVKKANKKDEITIKFPFKIFKNSEIYKLINKFDLFE